MTTIKLINGGEIIPLDLTPFQNVAHRVDPSTLPDLPAGITLDDLKITHDDPNTLPEERTLLDSEIAVRSCGYLPLYGPDGFDQFNYNCLGFDSDNRDRNGLTPEERNTDPMLQDVVRPKRYAKRTNEPDKRLKAKGYPRNKGNLNGQIVYSTDGTHRSLQKCWYDFFASNEVRPVQERLTDEEIVKQITEMFPYRLTKRMTDVKAMRWYYNKGKLGCQNHIPPKQLSYRYIFDKVWMRMYRTTPRGRVLQEWDIKPLLLGHQVMVDSQKSQEETPAHE